jgi:hypothetical protein
LTPDGIAYDGSGTIIKLGLKVVVARVVEVVDADTACVVPGTHFA